MSELLCRLCLSQNSLSLLFENEEEINERSSSLFLTTGLQIKNNDGLPQHICDTCTNMVASALELRKRSYFSEQVLFSKINSEKNKNEEFTAENLDQENKNIETLNQENKNCKKINQENKNIDYDENFSNNDIETIDESNIDEKPIWPNVVKKPSKKERRLLYLNMVEGEFDPNGPVKCKICKVTVSKWTCFLSHAKLHLGFNFVCEFCGKSFISTTKLNRHCRSHHGMKRELKCKHCSYLALDNAQLKLHIRRLHTGERPYICDICASSYHSRRCLVQHLESHRIVADVQCKLCPQVFKSARALSRHRYNAHAQSRVPCPHCARLYTRKYINQHISRYHDCNETESMFDTHL